MNPPTSVLWYDLETWGTDPRGTRIAQFAAQRTDAALNPIEEPVTIWVRPARDFLPSPGAAGVTGLSPQQLDARGITEAEAFAQIQALMGEPGTCCVGWNSLRFDDEFIRFGLYRNFFDPYEREWANCNSRWDLLDFARLCHALRPQGIVWPQREDLAATSFRLEHLAAANGIAHSAAHDAQSDVQATLGMARLFRARQPKLWDYHLGFRDKKRVATLLQPGGEPLLHVSTRFPAERACAGIVLPIAAHPSAGNQVLVVELSDKADWLDLPAEELAARIFTRADALPEGVRRIPVKAVHLNRCPALVALAHVREGEWQRLGIDPAIAREHAAQLLATPDLGERLRAAFRREFAADGDVDGALYDLLPSREDAALRRKIQRASPEQLASLRPLFRDPRGEALLWRYRARNWPGALSPDEQAQWRSELAERLVNAPRAALGWPGFAAELAQLRSEGKHALADALHDWASAVYAGAGLALPSSTSAIQ
jgi:exodeoxyribonuclease I